ncbi:hypothetical protein [Halobaculum litoreum]|uniref:hypothetical protein n=1 Tax=Halobaculum litoreum TaxID=3031998 RepID=UPI0024C46832|nr:hypothetical protein [Halobaculum sp. DT92]
MTDSGITFDDPEVVTMSLLQVGLAPTFYQFSEATIEVEMDIKTQLQTETNVAVETEFEADWGGRQLERLRGGRTQPEVRQGGPRDEPARDDDGAGAAAGVPHAADRDVRRPDRHRPVDVNAARTDG